MKFCPSCNNHYKDYNDLKRANYIGNQENPCFNNPKSGLFKTILKLFNCEKCDSTFVIKTRNDIKNTL